MYMGFLVSGPSKPSKHKKHENSDYNIANFDAIKLPCFRGMFLHPPQWWHDFCTGAIINTSCLSGQVTNEHIKIAIDVRNVWYEHASGSPSNHGVWVLPLLIFWV